MKQKTLKDKIQSAWEGYKGNIDVEDVVEHIKRLKEELLNKDSKAQRDKKIDKIMGVFEDNSWSSWGLD